MFCMKLFHNFFIKCSCVFTIAVLIGTIFLFRSGYDNSTRDETLARMMGPLSATDNNLINEVLETFCFEPPTQIHNSSFRNNMIKHKGIETHFPTLQFLNSAIREIYPPSEKKQGFFIEAGALDGVIGSNTLYLEQELGWTGLLVEPDGEMIQLLRSKKRHAWSCHCCLSGSNYPYKDILVKFSNPPRNYDIHPNAYTRLINSMITSTDLVSRLAFGHPLYESVQCLPVQTLLFAINVSKVDLFSLDIEGSEVPVLESFPWNSVTVDVWVVEHLFTKNKPLTADGTDKDFVDMFVSKGYDVYKISRNPTRDYIFVRKNSTVHQRLFKNEITQKPHK